MTNLPDISDPQWDAEDKIGYLTYLLEQGVPGMKESRGKLIDMLGNERNDLIEEGREGLSPLLDEKMQIARGKLESLIAKVQDEWADAIEHEGREED